VAFPASPSGQTVATSRVSGAKWDSGAYLTRLGARQVNQDLDEEAQLMTYSREFSRRGVYHIRVKGNLDENWSAWFDGFTITPQAHDETLLTGPVADQGALHGLLAKIRDLALPLLSVERVENVD
jgi:hypothetical protein